MTPMRRIALVLASTVAVAGLSSVVGAPAHADTSWGYSVRPVDTFAGIGLKPADTSWGYGLKPLDTSWGY